MKKRNKKFKIEKSPRENSLNLGPKPSLKGDFKGFGRHQDLEDGGRQLESRFSSSLAIFLSLICNSYHG